MPTLPHTYHPELQLARVQAVRVIERQKRTLEHQQFAGQFLDLQLTNGFKFVPEIGYYIHFEGLLCGKILEWYSTHALESKFPAASSVRGICQFTIAEVDLSFGREGNVMGIGRQHPHIGHCPIAAQLGDYFLVFVFAGRKNSEQKI